MRTMKEPSIYVHVSMRMGTCVCMHMAHLLAKDGSREAPAVEAADWKQGEGVEQAGREADERERV